MSVSQDFEARRKARLIRQRKQREKMRKIKFVASLLLFVLFIVFISVCISKCSKDNDVTQSQPEIQATVAPEPTPESQVLTMSQIPTPEVGDNDMLDVIKDSGQKKHVYLTFDDGPSEGVTEEILDVLRRYDIKATFFMVGKKIEDNPGLCARVIDEGHLAAVHTYSHSYTKVYSDESTFMDEVQKTYQLIVDSSPNKKEPFKIFRFPGGSAGNSQYSSIIEDCKESLARDGYYFCDWNCANADNENTKRTAEQLLTYFNNTRPDLNNLVIHMHDDDDNGETAKMLESLIPQLLDEGYTFSRLDEVDFSNAVIEDDEDEEDEEDDVATEMPKATEKPKSNSSSSSASGTNTATTAPKNSSTTNSTSTKSSSSGNSSKSNSTGSTSSNQSSNGGSGSNVVTSTNDINKDEHILDVQ